MKHRARLTLPPLVALAAALSACASDATPTPADGDAQALLVPTRSLQPPRLVGPLASSRATTRTPTLRWRYPAADARSLVLVCADRACARPERALLATGDAVTVRPALPAGVHFWKVYQYRGLLRSASASPTWSLHVGPRDAPVAASHGHAADYNGDGYGDLAIPAGEVGGPDGAVYVYHGSPAGLHPRPDRVLDGAVGRPLTVTRGRAPYGGVGDVNGDGYSDLALRANVRGADGGSTWEVLVFYGGADGLSLRPDRALTSPIPQLRGHGESMDVAGDLDGDGYGDLVVTDVGRGETFDDNAGFAFVYRGGAAGISATPDTTLTWQGTRRETLFGTALAAAGDHNADGFADLVVTAPERSSGVGHFMVFPGGAAGLSFGAGREVRNLDTRGGSKLGNSAGMAGDLDGDGYADVVVSQTGFNLPVDGRPRLFFGTRFLTYPGGAAGLATAPARALPDAAADSPFGSAAVGGDVNGDGYGDLAARAADAVHVFHGSPTGLSQTAARVVPAPRGGPAWMTLREDFNRDGYDDLYLSGVVYPGGPAGVAASPVVSLVCAGDRVRCDGACVDPEVDAAHCGACGNACGAGYRCAGGRCELTCAAGQTACGGRCVHLQTDGAHCGACGNACAAGVGCAGGRCAGCAAGQLECGGACVDPAYDHANCGACGAACGPGQTCVGGRCAACLSGATCDGRCVDPRTDPSNCGACGNACGADRPVCNYTCTCGDDQFFCGGRCVHRDRDAQHCGACGNACAPGQRCAAGVCVTPTAPANDECAAAAPITVGFGAGSYLGSTVAATDSAASCAGGADVWYAFTLLERAVVYVDTFGSDFDTAVGFATACGASPALCNDDGCGGAQSQASRVFDPGTYYVVVDGAAGARGSYQLHFQWLRVSPDAGAALPPGDSVLEGSTAGAGNQGLSCGTGGERWYAFVTCPADRGGQLTATTCGPYGAASYDTVLQLINADQRYGLCNDNACGLQSSLAAYVTPGAGLHALVVDGANGAEGDYRALVRRP